MAIAVGQIKGTQITTIASMHGSTEAELEYFRQQWREEMTARTRGKVTTVQQRGVPAKPQGRDVAATTITAAARRGSTGTTSTVTKREGFSDFATTAAASIEKNSQHEHARRGDSERTGDGEGDVGEDRAGDIWRGGEGGGEAVDGGTCVVEPQTALEHYERAVEKEGLGSLGESVDLYRKAFKVCVADDWCYQHHENEDGLIDYGDVANLEKSGYRWIRMCMRDTKTNTTLQPNTNR